MKRLSRLIDIAYPLTRQARTVYDAEGRELFTITRDTETCGLTPHATDVLTARIVQLLNANHDTESEDT
jgi:hypothetical protein